MVSVLRLVISGRLSIMRPGAILHITERQTSMTLTFARLTIEIARGHLYLDLASRSAVFIEFGTGLPWRDFARRRTGSDLELWGLGIHAVVSLNERPAVAA